jgi:anaphase-promoting complex subunit 1
MAFLHSTLGVLTSSQHYVNISVARDVYDIDHSSEYGQISPLRFTDALLSIYTSLKDGPDLGPTTTKARAQKAVIKMLQCGMTLADLDRLPLSVAAPLLEAIRTCQNSPPGNWTPDAYLFIGRSDLAKLLFNDVQESYDFGRKHDRRINSVRYLIFEAQPVITTKDTAAFIL